MQLPAPPPQCHVAPEGAPYELPPPLPPRPIEWRRAGRLVRELVAEPAATEKVFELVAAMGGRGDERTVQRFAAHPEGQALLREKPHLLGALRDRERLEAMGLDSFGGAYLAFAARNGFRVDGLLEANQQGLGELNARLDPDRRWFFDRLNLVHDLWHVLTGYETDAGGEMALLAFSIGQGLSSRTLHVLLLAGLAIAPKRDRFAFQRFVWKAHLRGRRAAFLLVQRYEELLPLPLADVRRRLRIAPVREAHPEGVFRAQGDPRDVSRVAA